MNELARQYALAAFSHAFETNAVELFQSRWQDVIQAFDNQALAFFNHPKMTKQEKKQVIESVVSDPLSKHLLFVLIDNHRLNLLHEIAFEYDRLVLSMNAIMEITVYSKQPLSEAQTHQFTERFHNQYHRTIHLINVVDESIIAGYRISYDGFVIDETINRQLDNLKQSLLK